MATVTINSYEFYYASGNVATDSTVVGNDSSSQSKPRVVRYSFTTGKEGANSIAFSKGTIGLYSGSNSNNTKLRFYVTTNSKSHIIANSTYDYHGVIEMTEKDGYYTAVGSATNLVLLPNTTYYLFIFPSYTTNLLWMWNYPNNITVTLSGAAGLVQIHNGTKFVTALPHIYADGKWKLAIPYVRSGSEWKISG